MIFRHLCKHFSNYANCWTALRTGCLVYQIRRLGSLRRILLFFLVPFYRLFSRQYRIYSFIASSSASVSLVCSLKNFVFILSDFLPIVFTASQPYSLYYARLAAFIFIFVSRQGFKKQLANAVVCPYLRYLMFALAAVNSVVVMFDFNFDFAFHFSFNSPRHLLSRLRLLCTRHSVSRNRRLCNPARSEKHRSGKNCKRILTF